MSQDTSDSPTFDALAEDYDRCLQHVHSEDSQFWRRTLFRTAFSMFEAMNCILRDKAVQAACSGDKTAFNTTRIELLSDYSYRVLKNGKLEQEPRRLPFLHQTAFILRSLAEESYTEATFFSEHGWNDFQQSVQVRHRLTHPKANTDMNITDEEIDRLNSAFKWYWRAAMTAVGNRAFWGQPGEALP